MPYAVNAILSSVQDCLLHNFVWTELPLQYRPYGDGGGFVYVRSQLVTPPPQLSLHALHAAQSDQKPSAHAPGRQSLSSLDSPKHGFPLGDGYGLLQLRSRRCMPTSHDTEHEPHSDHMDQHP